MTYFNPEVQLKDTETAIINKPIDLLPELKRFEFVTTFVRENTRYDDNAKYNTFYSNSKAEAIINESDIDNVFQSIYITIISTIQKLLGKTSS